MGISIVTQPNEFSPAYNPLVYIVDADNKNKTGFRYVVDLYEAGTSNKIYEARIAPRIGDGFGFIQLEKILQSKISYDLDLTNTTSLTTPNSYYEYDLKIGQEFVYEWSYDDYEYRGTNRVALNSTATHVFSIGDQINISQSDGGVEKPMLNGLFTIIDIPNDTEIIISIGWDKVGSGATISGVVRYADNRTLIERNVLNINGCAFNAALSFINFSNFDDSNLKLLGANPNGEILTEIKEGFNCSIDSIMFVNLGLAKTSNSYYLVFQNNRDEVFTRLVTSGGGQWIRQAACGPANISDVDFLDGIEYYDFYVGTSIFTPVTKTYRVYIDNRCEIENTKVLFMDRKGAFIPFSFALRSYEKGDVERTSYKKELKENSNYVFGYDKQFQGGEVTSVHVSKALKLTSNWLNDTMSELFEQLVTSPKVLMYREGIWLDVEIIDNSFDVDKQKNKKMIKKSINVRLLNQNNVNV